MNFDGAVPATLSNADGEKWIATTFVGREGQGARAK
jgi:hypothetical protein